LVEQKKYRAKKISGGALRACGLHVFMKHCVQSNETGGVPGAVKV
jgi:hypothetical protein